MTDNDTSVTPAPPAAGRGQRTNRRLGIIIVAALAGGVLGGAGGLTLAASGPFQEGWHGGWHHGPRLERIQGMVAHALDSVGATSAQEAKIHDILAANLDAMTRDTDRGAMGRKMLDLLRAPTIDRAAVEALRADQLATFDAKSKTLVAALLEAADQLTPDQRARLADRADAMMERHREMRGHDGPDGGTDGHGPFDGDHGPDGGPDGGPRKG